MEISTATLVPSVPGIDFNLFCDTDDESSRYILNHPFIQDGWLYATDTRILLAFKRDGAADTKATREEKRKWMNQHNPVDRKFPKSFPILEPALSISDAPDNWVDWPPIELLPNKEKCCECGQLLPPYMQVIFGRHINRKFDEAIRTLGAVSIGDADAFCSFKKSTDDPIYFRFPDPGLPGEWAFGVVMPLRQDMKQ